MPFIEQMLFGVDIKDENPSRTVLAQSPGMGQESTEEIVRLCENWGTAPPLGLEQAVLMSFRLTSSMPAIAGRLYTVIRASRGLNPLFHAVVLSEGAYATFMRNPFAVAHAVEFCDEWKPEVKFRREEISWDPEVPLVDPRPGKDDVGLVDEAVLKLIADGHLLMPIEQTNDQSDRCLALVIACMPEKDRKELRFASFAPSEANNYTLAGMHSEGCVYAGWQRMMMAWLAGDYNEGVESFIAEMREYLEKGDLAGIARTSQRTLVQSGPRLESVDKPRRETISASMPVQGSRGVAPTRRMGTSGIKPVPVPGPAASLAAPKGRTPAAPLARNSVPGHGSGHVSRPKPRKLSPLKKKKSGPSGSTSPRSISTSSFIRGVLILLILTLAGTAGVMWRQGKTLAESLEWANLQQFMGEQPRTERAATLLEVVDVGGVYARQLKLMKGSGKGLNPSVDKARRTALSNLRDNAATPLNQQVELFAKLAGDGIQQGSRPDRESQRMRSLASQGLVLENELARLELAWYSVAAGASWEDLPRLSDQAVIARRDSLAKAERGVLQDARRDLGTIEAMVVLNQTRGNVDGMASLLTLFETKNWSRDWENSLARAAGQVSPMASRMTRAYANSAFAFLSLKKAERRGQQTSLPYHQKLSDQDWPSAETRSLLTNLRAQTQIFADGQAPTLLSGTLELYSALKKPATLAARTAESPRVLSGLRDNRAVRFQPGAYDDFLERIRFEAAVISLDGKIDPDLIPDQLYSGPDRDLVISFRDTMSSPQRPAVWDQLAETVDNPFLAHWATHLGTLARNDLASAQGDFDEAWVACRKEAVRLQDEAAAGRDWTETWMNLKNQAEGILATHGRDLADDPDRSMKLADLHNLLVALKVTLPLELQAGTIRLDSDRLVDGTKARLEIRLTPDGEVWQSEKFYVGPAAPHGAGWVGTVSLEKSFQVRPDQGMEIKIVSEKKKEILLGVVCPSLNEGTGPGGMVRPRSGGRGSVSLKIDSTYWKSLQVPDLGMIF